MSVDPDSRPGSGRNSHGQFRKGQSGNPGGRKAVDHKVVELARTHTETAIKTLADICENKKAATNSRVAAANHLLNRAWGSPRQAVDLSTPDLPAGIQIVLVKPDDEPAGD